MMSHAVVIRIATPVLFIACWVTASLAQPAANGGAKFLVHGNYCGPGNNAPLAPIDALDEACAHHDACTPSRGLPTKLCNARLEQEATAIALDPREPDDLRAMAGVVAAFAAANPSKSSPNVVAQNVAATAAYIVFSALK